MLFASQFLVAVLLVFLLVRHTSLLRRLRILERRSQTDQQRAQLALLALQRRVAMLEAQAEAVWAIQLSVKKPVGEAPRQSQVNVAGHRAPLAGEPPPDAAPAIPSVADRGAPTLGASTRDAPTLEVGAPPPSTTTETSPSAPARPHPIPPPPAARRQAPERTQRERPEQQQQARNPPRTPEVEPQNKRRKPAIGLEEWLGVRGAAVGAGIVAAVAAVMLFRHAIHQQWLSPMLRISLSVLGGVLAIGAAHLPSMRKFAISANALIGAGCVALYAAFWSSHALYGLIGHLPSGLLMAMVTALCCTLSLRRGSIQIALLALVGGFASPLLLSSGADKPLELFGYLLLLDGAFLYLAKERDWPILAALSLLATFAFQLAWIGLKMGPERMWLGSAVLLIFGTLYAMAAQRTKSDSTLAWLWDVSTTAAVLLPFGFGLYFARISTTHVQWGPLFTMLFLVSAGTVWLRVRSPKMRLLQVAASAANVAVLARFLLSSHTMDIPLGLSVLAGLALLHHAAAELIPGPGVTRPWLPAIAASFGGALLVLVCSLVLPASPTLTWSCGVAGVFFSVALLRQATRQPDFAAVLAAVAGLSLAITITAALRDTMAMSDVWRHVAVVIGLGAGLQIWASTARDDVSRRWLSHGAALFSVICLCGLVGMPSLHGATRFPIAWLMPAVAMLSLVTAIRRDAGGWQLTVVITTIAAQQLHLAHSASGLHTIAGQTHTLVLTVVTAAALSWWPFLARRRFERDYLAWIGAALAAPLSFLPAFQAWRTVVGADYDGVLALTFAMLSGLGLVAARRRWDREAPFRSVGVGVFGTAALFFITLAIPLQLRGWQWTLGWTIEALALVALWRRRDQAGLKYLAMALFGAVGIRLLLNPLVLEDYVRGSWPILNQLTLTYLLPVVALIISGAWLQQLERSRARPWEPWLSLPGLQMSTLTGVLAILIGFAWSNLAVLDWFAVGETLTWTFEPLPARDLAFSICWALYAMILLGIGMRRGIVPLRYLSLGLLVITIGKVFLLDLDYLEDLYRVASLSGLAVSLFVVSLAYQRFVLRATSETPPPNLEQLAPTKGDHTHRPAQAQQG